MGYVSLTMPTWAPSAFRTGCDTITASIKVHDFGIFIDGDRNMQSPVQQTVAHCFAALHQLCSIWLSVPSSVYLIRLSDFGHCTFSGAAGLW